MGQTIETRVPRTGARAVTERRSHAIIAKDFGKLGTNENPGQQILEKHRAVAAGHSRARKNIVLWRRAIHEPNKTFPKRNAARFAVMSNIEIIFGMLSSSSNYRTTSITTRNTKLENTY